MWNTELNERWEELYSNDVLRGPGNCIMDSGQADAPNTPSCVPTVMGPVGSAADIAYATPAERERQLPEASLVETRSYVPAPELSESVPERTTS